MSRRSRQPRSAQLRRTSMNMTEEELRLSAKRAAQLGLPRSTYIRQLVRKDVGLSIGDMLMEGADDADAPAPFG